MDAMRFVVGENFATALIISDEAVWNEDIRENLRTQEGRKGEGWDVMFLSNATSILAYAVTQTGAKKIMYEHGMRDSARRLTRR
jgi:hypothetical protein